ncbi:hypothetical protein PG990_004969 [Apiospora arundinis]|uniref:Actin cortical patch SUR7/pH-response regulator pali n=1 Tax=Apiospora arundinis TaxID=335852 RepID=A0ABR2J655_9PEZI
MSIGSVIHHLGTLFVLVAFALLIVPDVTAPSVHHLSLFRVTGKYHTVLNNGIRGTPIIDYGSFGYCIRTVPTYRSGTGISKVPDKCFGDGVGYAPADPINWVYSLKKKNRISDSTAKAAANLTKTFVLIPLATATAFVAFLLALLSSLRPSWWASILSVGVSVLTFCLSFVAFVCGIVTFTGIRLELARSRSSVQGGYGVGMWSLLTAMICSLLGSLLIFFTCCSGRKDRQRNAQFAKAG